MCVNMLPRPQITSGVILIFYDGLNNFCCFSVALAVNAVKRHGPNNKMSPVTADLEKAALAIYI